MSETPLVSVLIGAYNAAPWLGEAVGSALDQTHPNVEVVVVDDGSTDETLALARSFEGRRVRVVAQENRGACAARNRALAEARGDYLQFLDADDVLHPEKLERQLRRLAEEPVGTVATGPWVRFQGAVADADHAQTAPDWRDYEPATDWLIQAWEGRGTIPSMVWLTPRAVAEAAGPWDEGLLRNQDGEYFARVVVEAPKIAFCEGAWSYYRSSSPASVSNRKNDAALRSLYDATAACERTLLGRVDTPEARRACSGLWQLFLFTAYPRVPELCRRAEGRVHEMGGFYREASVARPLRLVRDALGWKPALRLQRMYGRVRSRT